MKKTVTGLFSAAVCVLLIAAQGMTVFAGEGFSGEYSRLMDEADILTDGEEEELLASLDEISERQKMEVVIVTAESLEDYDSIQQFSDDVYDYCSYGYGENRDGVMLAISMEERDYYISTAGYGITAFTDAGIEYIDGLMEGDLSAGDYAAAFRTYITACDELISQARAGQPYARPEQERRSPSLKTLLIILVISLVLALFVVRRMKGELQTVHRQRNARNYVRAGSLNITQSRDQFLYRKTDRTKKAENNSTEEGGSESSTHTSSSGTLHGGGGGKF